MTAFNTKFVYTIIGGGPAGIAMAVELIELGVPASEVVVFEKGPNSIEAIRRFYPDKKMTIANYKNLPTETKGHISVFKDLTKTETITYFDEMISKYKINYQTKSEVSKITKTSDGFKLLVNQTEVESKFVVIAIGILGRPNKPDYKLPNSLRDHLLFDMTSQKVEGKKVLVVGGGDTSAEYCQYLLQDGNQVTMAYRGSAFNRIMDSNLTAIQKLEADNKLLIQMECEIESVEDFNGQPKVVYKNSQKYPAEVFDKIIFAIGGTTPLNFLKTAGVHCENNWPVIGENGETNIKGLYIIGDLKSGKTGGSIILCYNSAFSTAKAIIGL